jgi:uncharacterized protein (DUF924 family)
MAITKKTQNAILKFWFGPFEEQLSSSEHRRMWYASSAETDAEITAKFKESLLAVPEANEQSASLSPHARLALIVLLDQMSRNIFRGSAQAFAYDPLALALCLEGIKNGADQGLCLTERLFFYHPLEHAESLEAQDHCVNLMQSLVAEYSGRQGEVASKALKFAQEHRELIEGFGRFPHRNEVLGRESTAAELDYLNSGGKRFGQ